MRATTKTSAPASRCCPGIATGTTSWVMRRRASSAITTTNVPSPAWSVSLARTIPTTPSTEFLEQSGRGQDPGPRAGRSHPPRHQQLVASRSAGPACPSGPRSRPDHTLDEKKRKVRAHYSALIVQIDQRSARILDALEESGQLENTLIIFASDHGDMVGDHGINAKGNYYEGSCHVPMLVRPPGGGTGQVRDDLGLPDRRDGHACWPRPATTCPTYMDAQPLPGLGLPGESSHEVIVGGLANGWMAFDGRFKLVKYGNGNSGLFDLQEDPVEQHNLVDSAGPFCRLSPLWTPFSIGSS